MRAELYLEAPDSIIAPTSDRYDFDLSDAGGARGVSTICGWCLGAVGSSGECEHGCASHDRGRE